MSDERLDQEQEQIDDFAADLLAKIVRRDPDSGAELFDRYVKKAAREPRVGPHPNKPSGRTPRPTGKDDESCPSAPQNDSTSEVPPGPSAHIAALVENDELAAEARRARKAAGRQH